MITIQDLSWSNWASYGEDNYIDFEQPVLQIMGTNGAGKTTIPIILQELYYGKNSKGKKKSSLINRYIDKPELYAESNFTDEAGNKYKINLSRKSTLKLKLTKNGEDVSSHTTTNTYKTLQDIIGLDFKTFSQLIYQSSTDNLEFLTATDTNRKKFLISLFGLTKYLSIQDKFKEVSTELNTELAVVNSKMHTISSWIKKHENADLSPKEILDLPEIEEDDLNKLADIKSSLANITATNKKINSNNQLKELLAKLDTSILSNTEEIDKEYKSDIVSEGKDLANKITSNTALVNADKAKKAKIASLGDNCISCGQPLDKEAKKAQLLELETEIASRVKETASMNKDLEELRELMKEISAIEDRIKKRESVSKEFTDLKNSIDDKLQQDVLDAAELQDSMESILSTIKGTKETIDRISKANSAASAHNAKIEVILEQLNQHKEEMKDLTITSTELSDTANKVDIIKKAFGPSGLLSYKLDFLVKDLEKEINYYLGVLSGGKFQLIFKLENEKLNIEIIDESISVSIEELSAGELARINAATLLAIRKLMAAISDTKINILFLDEILGVLDEVGKEMLIEVLHKETELNTMLVSHEYSHPLIPKVTIVKENKISRIENEV